MHPRLVLRYVAALCPCITLTLISGAAFAQNKQKIDLIMNGDFVVTGWDDSFAAAVAFIQQWKNRNPRITPAIGPHAPFTVSPEHLQQALQASQQYHVPISIHVAETQAEVNTVLTNYGNPPVKHMDVIGVLQPQVIAAHMVWPNAEEIALLAQRGTGVIHNPTSNLKLASGFSPVPQMLAAGIKVGLGTDGAASNNRGQPAVARTYH